MNPLSDYRKNNVMSEVKFAFYKIGCLDDIIRITYGYSVCIGEYVKVVTTRGTYKTCASCADEMSRNIAVMARKFKEENKINENNKDKHKEFIRYKGN